MDRDLKAEHRRLAHLSIILGNAQLLHRRIMRSPTITPSEGDGLLRSITAIEEAAKTLHQDLTEPSPRTEES